MHGGHAQQACEAFLQAIACVRERRVILIPCGDFSSSSVILLPSPARLVTGCDSLFLRHPPTPGHKPGAGVIGGSSGQGRQCPAPKLRNRRMDSPIKSANDEKRGVTGTDSLADVGRAPTSRSLFRHPPYLSLSSSAGTIGGSIPSSSPVDLIGGSIPSSSPAGLTGGSSGQGRQRPALRISSRPDRFADQVGE